jgi:hypothetical protein
LVDTGADAILASDLLTEQLGIDLDENEGETSHAVGGRVVTARYKTVNLRLHSSDAETGDYREWQAQVGFIEKPLLEVRFLGPPLRELGQIPAKTLDWRALASSARTTPRRTEPHRVVQKVQPEAQPDGRARSGRRLSAGGRPWLPDGHDLTRI